jgi:hypothetical protein
MSKFKALLDELEIDETFTKTKRRKHSEYNHVKDNIPMKANQNMMADILFLPNDNGYKYLLVVVDLATDKFDMEPLKTKKAFEVLLAMKRMFGRPYIERPEASIKTDDGNEFKEVLQKYLYNNNILHKPALAGRHSQMANVEKLNRQIGRFLNGYMNAKEEKTSKTYTEWMSALPAIRKTLNKKRAKKMPADPATVDPIPFDPFIVKGSGKKAKVKFRKPKFRIDQRVHYLSPVPLTILGKKQTGGNLRVGDRQWSKDSYLVKEIYYYSNPTRFRYKLSGAKRDVSFMENELVLGKS